MGLDNLLISDRDVLRVNDHDYLIRIWPDDSGKVLVKVTMLYQGDETSLQESVWAKDGPGYIHSAVHALISDLESDLRWTFENHESSMSDFDCRR
jgi:hypothetical protein